MLQKLGIGLIVLTLSPFCVSAVGAQEAEKSFAKDLFLTNGPGLTISLLETQLVQKEIDLTAEQLEQIANLKKEMYESIPRITKELVQQYGEKLDRKKVEDKAAPLMREIQQKLGKLLRPSQVDRFSQIFFQMGCPMIIAAPMTLKELQLTKEQQSRIESLIADEKKLIRDRTTVKKDYGSNKEAKKEMRERNRTQQPLHQETEKKILDVLSTEQRNAYGKMKGEEVDIIKLNEQLVDALPD